MADGLAVVPGKKYRFSAWAKSGLKEGSGFIAMTFFTIDNHWTAPDEVKNKSGAPSGAVAGTTDWTKLEVTLTAPKDAVNAVLSFRLDKAFGKVWFDDVEFGEVD